MTPDKKLTILVSSTVYGYESILDMIYSLLTQLGYEVWMSHKETLPVISDLSNLENCLVATKNCDIFFGIITPRYGSGICGDGLSITHHELKKAIELNKLRWVFVHEDVFFARTFLNSLGFKGKTGRKKLSPSKTPLLDLRSIDMLEDVIDSQLPPENRRGNWAHKYRDDYEAQAIIMFQFSRYQEIESYIKENIRNSTQDSRVIEEPRTSHED
ncbi:MAG: DUF4062 domain-containing protein [Methanoregula sp.]